MDSMKFFGFPLPILKVEGRRKYLIDENAFNSVIDQCGDYPIAIYSQNGKRRKGKSLALNYMMLYLAAEGDQNWMDSNPLSDQILINTPEILSENVLSAKISGSDDLVSFVDIKTQGFIWKDGDDDTTQGITMWSKPFIVTRPDGLKVAVLLMDCQGNASDNSDNVDNGVIFSLSILLSSVFIYNISGDLDNVTLQFFHQYADFAIQVIESNYDDKHLPSHILSDEVEGPKYNKHFQELLIWVRDWLWTSHYPLGVYNESQMPSKASKNFKLDKVDPSSDESKQSSEVRSVRIAINSMFQRVSCLLSPFPGEEVVSRDFNGKVNPESEFGKCLKNFVEKLLSPTNIVTKFIGNRQLTGETLKKSFRHWAAVYRDSEKLPKFKSATETTHELICRDTIKKCWDHYMDKMSLVSKLPTPIEPNAFKMRHSEISKECVDMYNVSANVGLFQVKLKYMKELVKQIEMSYTSFVDSNNERWKRIHQDLTTFGLRMTPVVSAFLFAAEGVVSLQKKEYKEAAIKFLEAATIGILDVVTFGAAGKTKLVYRAGRETLRVASAFRASKEQISQLRHMSSNSSDIFRTYAYTAAGMVKNLIQKISRQEGSPASEEYDNIQLRRLIAASALQDMNIVDQERQQLLLDILEKKFEENPTRSEKYSAADLLDALNAILESESRTTIDDEFVSQLYFDG